MTDNYLLYGHGGCENHGCEAIVRSICSSIRNKKPDSKIILAKQSVDIGIDEKICLDIDNEILQNKVKKFSFNYLISGIAYLLFKRRDYYFNRIYKDLLNWLKKNKSICISIGGDNYCYNMHNSLYFLDKKIRMHNYKNILWGCSIEPSSLHDKKLINDLNGFDIILARERITYNALKEALDTKIELCPDPAFLLETESVNLDEGFKKNGIVGINISPTVSKELDETDITFANYKKMIDYLLKQTKYNILLIPHVTWEKNNDMKPLTQIYNIYKKTNRVKLLNEMNCKEAKGYISQCEIFVGARTHSTIAAYSSCVPTIVVGYSVKANGIANDLFGTDENYVIDSRNLKEENELLNKFILLDSNKEKIKAKLKTVMPEYLEKCRNAINYLDMEI